MTIKHTLWAVAAIFGVVIILGTLYIFVRTDSERQKNEPLTTLPDGGATQPGTIDSPGINSPDNQQNTIVSTQDGGSLTASNFLQNGVTIADTANPGRYLLSGDLGYCLDEPARCRTAESTTFNVFYNSGPQSFTIALTEEPIGEARSDMERFMLATLGLSPAQLCRVNYYVGVMSDVNEQYSGENLGFSFCPGATKLPN